MLYNWYKSVDKFIGRYFARYGRFVARHPWKIVIISVIVNVVLGLGLFNINLNSDALYLFTPLNNRASRETEMMDRLFPDRSATNFYGHTMYKLERFTELIIKSKTNSNVLTDKIMLSAESFLDYIMEKEMSYENGTKFRFQDVCAKREGHCVTRGQQIFEFGIRESLIAGKASFPVFHDVYLRPLLGSPTIVEERVVDAKSLKFRFHARNDEGGKQWEQEFRKTMESYHSDEIDFAYLYSESMNDEVNATIEGDTLLFVATIVLMISFASFATMGGNCLTERSHLGRAGVFTAAFGILGAFGLVCASGVMFVNIVGVAPFLVVGVGLDDMFILLSGLSDTYHIRTIEDRIGQTMRTSGMAITITSVTDLLAFSVGATSTFPAIRSFCIYTGVAIFFTYIMFVTFFLACMTLYEKRVEDDRHCLTCRKIMSKQEMEDKGMSKLTIMCCGGSKAKVRADVQNPIEKYISDFCSWIVLSEPIRFIVILVYLGYIGISIWGAMYFDEGILLKQLTSEDSHFYKHSEWNTELHQVEVVMTFVITEPVMYINSSTIMEIDRLTKEVMKEDVILDDFFISWYDGYERSSYFDNSSESAFANNLQLFVNTTSLFLNDVAFTDDGNAIKASRMYYKTYGMNDAIDFRELMIKLRKLADGSTLPVIAFSPVFIFIEQVVAIVPQTIQNLAIAMGSIMFVTILMIPHPSMVLLITLSVASILVGLIGFMHLWGLMLSSITMVEIIMCIGFSIDYSSHIVHAYMQAEGYTRDEKIRSALRLVGGPVFSGVSSTFVGVIMLLFANSFVYMSFFKVIFLVLALGLAHALVIIPVMLTFIGPVQSQKGFSSSSSSSSSEKGKSSVSSNDISFSSDKNDSIKSRMPFAIPRPRLLLIKNDKATEKYVYTNEAVDKSEDCIFY